MATRENRARHAEWARQYRADNRDRLSKRASERRAEVKAYIDGYKRIHGCMDCRGYFPEYVLQFDHREGKNHKKYITSGVLTIASFQRDVEDCDLVCANCHCIRTHNRRTDGTKTAVDA